MYSSLMLLFLISFLIFFRSDVVKILKKFDDHPYLLTASILILINYCIILHLTSIQHFILIFGHLFLNITKILIRVFQSTGLDNPGDYSRWMIKVVILGFLMFYPVYYQNKYKSLVYTSERISVRVIYFVLTVFFFFFCLHYKI